MASSYTPEIAELICEKLAAGETLRSICRNTPGLPAEGTVRGWVVDDREGFAERYNRARNLGLDGVADEIVEISDDARNDWMRREDPDNPGYDLNGEHIARSRLRVDSRKWYLSKMAPKKYGERLALAGDADSPLVIEHRKAGPCDLEQALAEILVRVAARRAYELSTGVELSDAAKAIGRFEEVQRAADVIEGVYAEVTETAAPCLPAPDISDLA